MSSSALRLDHELQQAFQRCWQRTEIESAGAQKLQYYFWVRENGVCCHLQSHELQPESPIMVDFGSFCEMQF